MFLLTSKIRWNLPSDQRERDRERVCDREREVSEISRCKSLANKRKKATDFALKHKNNMIINKNHQTISKDEE
jgi:hypothetical protein